MGKKSHGRNSEQLDAAVDKANAIISRLALQDEIDTNSFGFMVKRAGDASLALHPGLHPSEQRLRPIHGTSDPRHPRARQGLSLSGSLKMDVVRDIEARHEELVRLERWHQAGEGKTPCASRYRWDPVLLALLRLHGADLDAIVANGPGEFVNPAAHGDNPSADHLVTAPNDDDTGYLGCIDGDTVRALRIRYGPGIVYGWDRRHPDHIEFVVRDRKLPQSVMIALHGNPFSTLVSHPSLATMSIEGYSSNGNTISFKTRSTLVSLDARNGIIPDRVGVA